MFSKSSLKTTSRRRTTGLFCLLPSLEGAYTCGETREQALERVQEVVKMILNEMRDEGKAIPPDAAILEVEKQEPRGFCHAMSKVGRARQ
jgi:predicted RNase H-like HicB family nuclease